MTKQNDNKRGYTLIELLVSLGIFMIVMTVAMGSLFTIISANKRARALQLSFDNLHFAIDEMSRDVRTGNDYVFSGSGNDCNSSFVFSFSNSSDTAISYRCDSGRVQKRIGGGSYVDITAPEITVTSFHVYDRSTSQPRAVIVIGGEVEAENGVVSDFNLQTTISQRKLDLN
ncbi:MAG: type II secretion system protein [Candidatus Paceibacterota bacterium]